MIVFVCLMRILESFLANITEYSKNNLTCQIVAKLRDVNISTGLILALAMIKTDNFISATRAATQLGVTKIIPVITEYCQVSEIKQNRLERCIIETTQQCERITPPKLMQIITLDKLLMNNDISQIIWADEQACHLSKNK